MHRILQFLAGPEVVLGIIGALVFAFCAHHNSYNSEDVRILERVIWLLPLIVVPAAFATMFLPGAKTWWWLGRTNVAMLVCLCLCAHRLAEGLGAPGSGPKGQDAAMILIVSLGVMLGACANAVAGAIVLRANHASFDEWFRLRPFVAPMLTALAAVPVMVVQTLASAVVIGVGVAIFTAVKR